MLSDKIKHQGCTDITVNNTLTTRYNSHNCFFVYIYTEICRKYQAAIFNRESPLRSTTRTRVSFTGLITSERREAAVNCQPAI